MESRLHPSCRALEGGGGTCLEDVGGVLGDPRGVTEPTEVFAENTEVVLIAHNEVRDGAAGVSVVFIYGEPLLGQGQRDRHKGTQTQEGQGIGEKHRRVLRKSMIYSSIIHNCQQVKTTQVSINGPMTSKIRSSQAMEYYLSPKREKSADMCIWKT
jgi:hypothetical protein